MTYRLVLTLVATCICGVRGDCVSETPPDPKTDCCGVDLADDGLNLIGNAALNQFPWIALIEDPEGSITCTGVLISSRHVLTAAQCLYHAPARVRLGDFNKTNSGPDCTYLNQKKTCNDGAIAVRIESYIPHPNFSQPNYRGNDIAILKLVESAPYTDFIRPICLPTSDFTVSPPANLKLINAGWGSKPSSDQEDDVVKHYVKLPYKTLRECQLAYNTKWKDHHTIGDGHICAGGEEGLDSCRGDGGGPLMYEKDGKYTLVGIVSFGPAPCGQKGIPSVYTKVFHYLPWINNTIRPS